MRLLLFLFVIIFTQYIGANDILEVIKSGNLNELKLLKSSNHELERRIELRCKYGGIIFTTALREAIRANRFDMVEYLLDRGVALCPSRDDGEKSFPMECLFITATLVDDIRILIILLKNGLNPNLVFSIL